MSRLTKKVSSMEAMLEYGSEYIPSENCHSEFELYYKLGKLEDLEEQLGCPLEVVFKALKEGIVVKELNNFIFGVSLNTMNYNGDFQFLVHTSNYFLADKLDKTYTLALKDYGTTWWLKSEREEKGE